MAIVLAGFSLFFVGSYILLGMLLLKHLHVPVPCRTFFEPTISIIIAARNEEKNLPACLESLLQLDYPKEKMQIFVMDDDSEDATPQIASEFARRDCRIHYVKVLPHEKRLQGKAGVIEIGIQKSAGEIIFMTDADCRVSSQWIRGLLNFFAPECGMVGGFTILYDPERKQNVFENLQTLDLLFLLGVASSASQMQKPLSWVGNNLAFRRIAFDQAGGYGLLRTSLVEDFHLINRIAKLSNWKIRFVPWKESLVFSKAEKHLASFFYQRKRWATGFNGAPAFGKILIVAGFLSHLVLLIWFFHAFYVALFFFLCISLINFFILSRLCAVFDRRDLIRHFPAYTLYFFFYLLTLPVLIMFDKRVRWKDRLYDTGMGR